LSFFNDLDPFIPSSARFLTLALLIDNRATSEEEKNADKKRRMMKKIISIGVFMRVSYHLKLYLCQI
jgi:hypothetical protein